MKTAQLFPSPVIALAIVFGAAFMVKADLVIDPFNSYQSLSTAGPPAGVKTAFSSISDPVVLGGERDVWLSRNSANSGSVSVDVNGSFTGALAYASSPATTGNAVISYDGADGVSGLNYTGLGGIDLTQAGANYGLALGTTSDNGASALFTIYTDATHYSTYTVPVASDFTFTFTRYFVNFNDFVPAGGAGGVDFTNVGAITIGLDGNTNPGTDIGVDYFLATVPEPSGSLLILASGMILLLKRPHSSRRRLA